MGGTENTPDDMRRDQVNKTDHPRKGHRGTGQQRGQADEDQLGALELNPHGHGLFFPEGQDVHFPGKAGQQENTDDRNRKDHTEMRPVAAGKAAHLPGDQALHMLPKPVGEQGQDRVDKQ